MTGNSQVTTLSGANAAIDLSADIKGKDIINIANSNTGTGTQKISVKETNSQLSGDIKSLVAVDESQKLTFEGKELNSGGLYTYDAKIEKGTAADEMNWYLTGIERQINYDTAVLLCARDNSYALWRNTNDSMNDRLGELHNINTKTGAWARFIDGRFDGNGYDGDYNTVQMGFDKAVTDNYSWYCS